MNRIQHVRSVCAALLVVLSPILFSDFAHAGDVINSQNTDRLTVVEDSLVSIFENSTLEIQYGFIKDIGDGNGFTAGRAGFTSRTGDMLEVLKEYEKLRPGSMLSKYIEPLHSVLHTASTRRIAGLASDWPLAAERDPLFRKAQDLVNERLYRQSAKAMALSLGLKLPLSRAALYEAGIQHGYGEDHDSLSQIVARTNQAAGGTPGSGVDEVKWLDAFIDMREQDLRAPANKAYGPIFLDAVDRARAIRKIFEEKNYDLFKPITITVYGDTFTF